MRTKLPYDTLPERIYFFRHAQSVGNALGMNDVSLKEVANHRFSITERGAMQAAQLADFMAANGVFSEVDEVYVSTFLRAQQTLDIVLPQSKLPVYEDVRLDEWWKGIYYSLDKEDFEAHHAHELPVLQREGWYYYKPPQGESGKDVEARILSFLGELRAQAVIAGHGRIAGFMKRLLCNEPWNLNCHYDNPRNCELWLFEKENRQYRQRSLFIPAG